MQNNKEKTKQARHAKWLKDYQEFLDSGLTAQEFCDKKGFSKTAFYSRLKALKKDTAKTGDEDIRSSESSNSSVDVIEIKESVENRTVYEVEKSSTFPVATIRLGQISIEISNDISADLLSIIVRGLQNA